MAKIPIKNTPNVNELWKGIGGYFDSLGEIICEFIDNSVSNFNANNQFNRTILVKFEKKRSSMHIVIEDSGTGIKDLDAAFTLGSHDAAETLLNEHGFGFKHALASANPDNDSWKIMTRTKDDENKSQYREIKAPYLLEGLEAVEKNDKWPTSIGCATGTIVEFDCSMEMFKTITRGLQGNYQNTEKILSILIEDLGFIYSGVLRNNGTQITIVLEENEDIIMQHNVGQINPLWEGYYDPKQGSTKINLGSGEVEVEYCFGKIAESTNNKKYYKKNMATSGVEIRINGRLLAHNIIKQIWGKENHPSYNQFLATINLVSNDADKLPKTKTSKNGLREGDLHLEKLFEWIRNTFPTLPKNENPLPEDRDEREMFEELRDLKRTHMQGDPTVETEVYAFDSLNDRLRIDLYVGCGHDLTIYEGKRNTASVKDLYQLIMYWDGCVYDGKKPTKGILLAPDHTDSLKNVVEVINEMTDGNGNNYDIELKTWREEGITYPI